MVLFKKQTCNRIELGNDYMPEWLVPHQPQPNSKTRWPVLISQSECKGVKNFKKKIKFVISVLSVPGRFGGTGGLS